MALHQRKRVGSQWVGPFALSLPLDEFFKEIFESVIFSQPEFMAQPNIMLVNQVVFQIL